jgi:hypothetical protein
MITTMRIAIVLAILATRSGAQESEIPILSVCEALKDVHKYSGKSLIVVGRSASTGEGSWLDEECGFKVHNDGREFQTMISLAYVRDEFDPAPELPRGFRWNMSLIRQQLVDVQRTTKLRVVKEIHYSDEWLAVYGRFETQLPRKIKGGHTDGFGHLSAAPAQLISPKRRN